ncbi:MAG: hypothetical protein QW112_02985, partial [Candidatus Micrarchaeia archaeon]
ILLDAEGEKEMTKLIELHNFTVKEADRLRELSKKYIIPPERVAATIALNQFTYNQVKNWEDRFKSGEKRYGLLAAIAIELTEKHWDNLQGKYIRRIKSKDKKFVDKIRSEATIEYYKKRYGDPKEQ